DLKQDWRVAAPVLSIGIRNPLDRAAAAILAHLAIEHGIGARVLGAEDVTPAKVNELDIGKARLGVLSNLHAARAPAHTRLLMRRLGRRAPGLAFLIGAWGERQQQPAVRIGGFDEDAGGAPHAATLRQALEFILAAARREGDTPADQTDAVRAAKGPPDTLRVDT